MKPKVYAFVRGEVMENVLSEAYAEDGELLAYHLSSTREWAVYDMSPARKGRVYLRKYPGGFDYEWVNDPDNHPVVSQFRKEKR